MEQLPACVIDIGSGYTKLGYAGAERPQFLVPTVLAINDSVEAGGGGGPLDFCIGQEALEQRVRDPNYSLRYPVRQGRVEDWDLMEKFLTHCLSRYLMMAVPEERYFLLTGRLLSRPEARENMAQLMFETFNVPGLHLADPAMLALPASWVRRPVGERSLTGLVVDVGEDMTHVTPVIETYPVGSCIRSTTVGGLTANNFIQQLLCERESGLPAQSLEAVVEAIKQRYCYTCPDILRGEVLQACTCNTDRPTKLTHLDP